MRESLFLLYPSSVEDMSYFLHAGKSWAQSLSGGPGLTSAPELGMFSWRGASPAPPASPQPTLEREKQG